MNFTLSLRKPGFNPRPHDTGGVHSGTATGFLLSISVVSCQYHSTDAVYPSSRTGCCYRKDWWVTTAHSNAGSHIGKHCVEKFLHILFMSDNLWARSVWHRLTQTVPTVPLQYSWFRWSAAVAMYCKTELQLQRTKAGSCNLQTRTSAYTLLQKLKPASLPSQVKCSFRVKVNFLCTIYGKNRGKHFSQCNKNGE